MFLSALLLDDIRGREDHVPRRLASRLGHVDRHLSQHEYMLGKHFSLADAYLLVVLSWARLLDVDLSPYPHVLAHRKRVGSRPAARAALEAEA